MRPEPEESLHPKAMTLWRVHAALRTLTYALFAGFGLLSLMLIVPLPGAAVAMGLGALSLHGAVGILIIPPLRYKYWRYHVGQSELDIQSGVFVIQRTLVPLVRVQNVDSVQGPLAKRLGLSSVTVSTAASTHEIPALSEPAADQLRDLISQLAQDARESL